MQKSVCKYEGVIVATALCGAESWGMKNAKRRVNVLEIDDESKCSSCAGQTEVRLDGYCEDCLGIAEG